MAGKEIWFRRGDGTEMCCTEGSVAFGLMDKDGSFTLIDGPAGAAVAPDANAEQEPEDLLKLTVKQLYERAALSDVPVTEKMKKAELIAAIQESQAKTATAE